MHGPYSIFQYFTVLTMWYRDVKTDVFCKRLNGYTKRKNAFTFCQISIWVHSYHHILIFLVGQSNLVVANGMFFFTFETKKTATVGQFD